jgi:hypothetical protein
MTCQHDRKWLNVAHMPGYFLPFKAQTFEARQLNAQIDGWNADLQASYDEKYPEGPPPVDKYPNVCMKCGDGAPPELCFKGNGNE